MAITRNIDSRRADIRVNGCRHEDPKIAALQIAALDDDDALAVYGDWGLTHVRPQWNTNQYYKLEWWRGDSFSLGADAKYRLYTACADILSQRSGECLRIVEDDGKTARVETWAGRVCRLWHRTERIMSDVWATVFYADVLTREGKVQRVEYGCDEFSASAGHAEVDAPPTIMAAYRAEVDRVEREAKERDRVAKEKRAAEEAAREAATPYRGKRVKVVRGRKVAKGTTGIVGWYGQCRYGNGYRVGIDTAAGERVWTNARNVEVVAA